MSVRRLAALGSLVLVTALGSIAMAVGEAGARQNPEPESVALHFQSKIGDLGDDALAEAALTVLNDPRGWGQAGFTFRSDPTSPYRVVLAEPAEVDALCLPLVTGGRVSCQNGDVVALNANRWRNATDTWDKSLDEYRQYLFNHEVGHLIGQFHPANRCPQPGEPEAVMAQQTKGLEGCQGNPWPLDWEIVGASKRPVGYAPTPDVEPAVRAVNPGGGVPGTAAPAATSTPTTAAAAGDAETDAEAQPAPDEAETPPEEATDASAPEDAADEPGPTDEPTAENRQLEKAPLSGLASNDARSSDGSNVPVIIVLSFLAISLVTLGVTLLVRWRSNRRNAWEGDGGVPDDAAAIAAPNPTHTDGWESESIDDLFGWAVDLGGGAGQAGGVTWVVPTGWTPDQTAEFVAPLSEMDPHSVEPGAVAACVSTLLRARRDLRPQEGEGLGVVVVGSNQLVAAVMGAAEIEERRGTKTISTRRQGVVRLRSDGEGPLTVSLTQAGNDWPTSSVTVRERLLAVDGEAPDLAADQAASFT